MPEFSFYLEIDPAQIKHTVKELSHIRDGTARALSGALNKTLEHGRTLVKKAIMDELNVSQKAALRAVTVKKSGTEELSGSVSIARKEIPMGEYHPKQTKLGVKVALRKGQGARIIRGAFIATMPLRGDLQREQHVGVFARKGDAKHKLVMSPSFRPRQHQVQGPALPIRELMGPTAIGVFAGRDTQRAEKINDEMNASMRKNIESQIQRLKAGR